MKYLIIHGENKGQTAEYGFLTIEEQKNANLFFIENIEEYEGLSKSKKESYINNCVKERGSEYVELSGEWKPIDTGESASSEEKPLKIANENI